MSKAKEVVELAQELCNVINVFNFFEMKELSYTLGYYTAVVNYEDCIETGEVIEEEVANRKLQELIEIKKEKQL